MHRESWDDLRFVLAVIKHGSVAAASRALGVNHATVLRRVAQFEDRHGLEVFRKTPTGYRVPPELSELVDVMREAEHAVIAVEQLIRSGQQPLRGDIRITSTDTLCALVLPRVVQAMQQEEAALSFELLSSNLHLDPSHKLADIFVRPSSALSPDLRGQPAGHLGFAVYTNRDIPNDDAPWLGLSGPLQKSVAGAWMDENVARSEITAASDSFMTLASMLAQGPGRTYLPVFVGDRDPQLTRCEEFPFLRVELWVACHANSAQSARTQRVISRLAQGLLQEEAVLAGA